MNVVVSTIFIYFLVQNTILLKSTFTSNKKISCTFTFLKYFL